MSPISLPVLTIMAMKNIEQIFLILSDDKFSAYLEYLGHATSAIAVSLHTLLGISIENIDFNDCTLCVGVKLNLTYQFLVR